MKTPPIPVNEAERIAALARYNILYTLAEKEFDDLTRLAAHICGTPVALISLIDSEVQWIKSKVGIDEVQWARAISFCGHTISGQGIFEVPDALEDERFSDNPMVTGAPNIRFYAGMPLVTHDGHSLGVLCVIDQVPRHLLPEQREALGALARQVTQLLEIRLLAREREQAQCQRDRFFSLSLDLFCIAGTDGYFKRINPAFSEALGYEMEALLARPFLDFIHPDDHAVTLAEVDKLSHGQRSYNFENRFRCKDGSWKLLSWKVYPFADEGLLYASARDITMQRELEVTLQQRNEALGRSEEELQRAISDLNQLMLALEDRVTHRTRQLAATVDEFRETEARTRLIIDTALDAMVTMDAHGLVRDWNKQAEITFGWKRAEAMGQAMSIIVPWTHRAAHARGMAHFLATGEGPVLNRRIETTALHRDGREFPVELSITPMKVKDEWIFSAFLRDITDRKQVEERGKNINKELEQRVELRTAELVAAKEAADLANRAKSTFLATMSHEIRTPMNGMFGMLELLSLTKLDDEQSAKLNLVRESGKALLRIIDDILDFSKIEAGKLDLHPEISSVRAVIGSVIDIYAGNASSNGLLLKQAVDPRLSPALLVDHLRLRQILNNLVSNALKFTPRSGTIEVEAAFIERIGGHGGEAGPGHERVRFSVKDSGIGISAEDQQRLFKPFIQIETNINRRYSGTGLGLTICQRLAEMMGGSIDMVSELGKGTTMSLTLLLPISDPKCVRKTEPNTVLDSLCIITQQRRIAPTLAKARAEGTLLLLVDDHPTNRLLLLRQANALGYAAETADDGVDALRKWQSGHFGMIITDCNMPEMDGYELTRNIRRIESKFGNKRTPIVACTANAIGEEAAVCIAAGMDDYLAKPIELAQLGEKLDRWLPIPDAS